MDRQELLEKEKYFINTFDTYKNGYNMTIGGDGVVCDVYLKVALNKKQKRFVELVEKENKATIDVTDDASVIRSIGLNLSMLFLISDSKIDKRQIANLLLRMRLEYLEELLKIGIFTINELRRWAKWRSTPTG